MSLLSAMSGGGAPAPPPALSIGVVVSLDDPDKLGRVEVKLPDWGEAGASLGFLRVLTPMCGAEWGIFCLPEVGDEVLVGFPGGGLHSPCVLGSFWNAAHKPPVLPEEGKNDVRLIKSRGGHLLSLTDKEDEEKVELTSAKGLRVLLDDKAHQILLSDKDGKNSLLLDGESGAVTVTAEHKLILKAGQDTVALDGGVTAESGGALKLKGQDVKLDAENGAAVSGKASVEVKSAGRLALEANGAASLKGMTLKLN